METLGDIASNPDRTETSFVETLDDGGWAVMLMTLWCPDLEQDVGWCTLMRTDGAPLEDHEQLQRVALQVLECEPHEAIVPVMPDGVERGDDGLVASLLVLPTRVVSGHDPNDLRIRVAYEADRAVLRLGVDAANTEPAREDD